MASDLRDDQKRSLLESFIAVTGLKDEDTARLYLESAHWNINVAADGYFAKAGAGPDIDLSPASSRIAPSPEVNPPSQATGGGKGGQSSKSSGGSSSIKPTTGYGLAVASGDTGSDADSVYNMNHNHRGKFILINNKKFQSQTGMGERTGTDVDASNLMCLFEKLGFDVQQHNDLTAYEMMKVMIEIGKEDHSENDCFAVAVLSHGEQGILYGVDGIIEMQSLIDPIKMCQSLAGKPKLFFIQACRGSKFDDGIEVEQDADVEQPRALARIPQEADFLFAFSTTPGYYSWRNSNKGSWFVQALYLVLDDLAFKGVDLLHMLTRVNKKVAYNFESNATELYMSRKKQVPSIVSQLTKDVYFSRK